MNRQKQAVVSDKYMRILAGTLVLFGLYLTSFYNYLLFHSLAEIFSIVVACGIFVIFWNSRRFLEGGYFLFIGIAYLFVGGIDLTHTLAYVGMGVFPEYDANLPTQLWIAARYLESLSLLVALLFIRRRLEPGILFIGYVAVVSLLLGSIFYWNVFPDCFITGTGLTPFKKISEYIISLLLLASVALLFQKRSEFDRGVLQLLIASIVLTIGSELAFTFYISVYDFSNLVGHLLKIVSVYFIYKAFIEIGLTKPYNLLFRNLKQSEEALRKSEAGLTEAQRIAHLGSWDWDIINNTLDWSDETHRTFDLAPQEFGGTYEAFLSSVHPDDREFVKRSVNEALYEHKPYSLDHRIILPDGSERIMQVQAEVIFDDTGQAIRMIGTVLDSTERKQAEEQIKAALAEKVILLREIHHRVKNNLTALIYLIDMQVETIEAPEVIQALTDFQGRARAMAIVHEKLYQSEDLSQVDFGEYLYDLTSQLFYALRVDQNIALHVEAADISININLAVPCGLIVNELVTNALKYAFPQDQDLTGFSKPVRSEYEIRVAFELQNSEYLLTVSDNGIGLPPELDWRKTQSLGLKLVDIWATRQLGGCFEVDSRPGTVFTIRFAERK